jgi:hypothetical protein
MCQHLFVLAEPGFGKSVLLENLVTSAESNRFEAVVIDLKSLDNTLNLFDNIEKIKKRPETKKTSKLNIENKQELLICLDALDEVSVNIFSDVIGKIKNFLSDFNNVKVFISCRTLYFEKYEILLNSLNFSFLKIEQFSNNNIFDYLSKNEIDADKQDLIRKNFFESYYAPVLYTPRYLELLVKYIKENKSYDISGITRCELFEYFIYNKLKKEKAKQKEVDISVLKRVIETLALVMEIYQVNSISKDELMSFFADIQNDLKVNILSKISIEDFIERSTLKDNIDFVEFENTEFQEYLAAKEISRLKDIKQSVFDLAVDKELKEIYPSWFNVLSFLIELNIDLLKDVLDYGMSNQKTVTEGYFDLITKVNSNLLSIEIRDKIFKRVFEYYQINDIYINNYPLIDNLSYYYTENNSELLKSYYNKVSISSEYPYSLKNIFNLIYYICERKLLSLRDIRYWTNKYEKILTNNSIDISVKKDFLIVTKYFHNKNIINTIINFPYHNDEYLWESIIENIYDLTINEKSSIHLLIDGLEFKNGFIKYYLPKIKSSSSLKYFFKSLSNDNYIIDKFLDNYSINEESDYLNNFFKNIKNCNDRKLLKIIKGFVIKSCSENVQMNYYSHFLRKVINFISSINREFIFELIDNFSVKKDFSISILTDIFSECLYIE